MGSQCGISASQQTSREPGNWPCGQLDPRGHTLQVAAVAHMARFQLIVEADQAMPKRYFARASAAQFRLRQLQAIDVRRHCLHQIVHQLMAS